jgi:hypothetical protein
MGRVLGQDQKGNHVVSTMQMKGFTKSSTFPHTLISPAHILSFVTAFTYTTLDYVDDRPGHMQEHICHT